MPASRRNEGLMSKDAQERLIEGARKGGKALKHFTPESKERQREGARKGGEAKKHFTSESKDRQIEGARKGGQHSHMHDPGWQEPE
jgi:general stress protein YciG